MMQRSRTKIHASFQRLAKVPRVSLAALVPTRHLSDTSSESKEQAAGKQREVLLYEGMFANKMKYLRRISLGSTILSTVLLPAAMTMQSGLLPMAAQMALAGTVFFSSVSSTMLLQVVAHPYVCTLHEIVESSEATPPVSSDAAERKFRATRYNMLGKQIATEFTLKQADRSVSNPFASFQVKPAGYFYIFGGEIQDPAVRRALTKEG